MNPTDEGIDQHVDDALSELAGHEGPDGAVPDRPADVRSGQDGVTSEPERTADADNAGARRGPEPGRYPECVAFGQGTQAPARPDRGTPGRDGHERVGQSDLSAQVDRLRAPSEEPVRPQIDHATPDLVALQWATESG